MAQDGVLGNGVKVAYSAGSPVSWVELGQIMELQFPTFNPDKVPTSVHGGSKFKRNMPGKVEVGDCVMTFLADLDEVTSPEQAQLWTLQQAGTTVWWRIEIPTVRDITRFTAFEFQGYVGPIEPGTPIEGAQTLVATVVFDGTSFSKYPAGASAI